MSIFICWVLFPLLFCLLALGCGLLVQRVAGVPMRGLLLLPVGFATIVVLSQITTYWGATTFLATPAVVVAAVAGFALTERGRRAVNGFRWPAAAAVGVFGIFAAPVVLSGHATFLGYTLLGDTAIHFALIDFVMKHGFAHVPAGPPSSYHAVLVGYLGNAYPVGAHTALGAVRPLVGQDVAWVYQPYLALLAAFTSLSIYAILARAIAQRWLLALAAFLAAQPALVYAYALEGSVKEMAAICLIPMLVAVGADYVTGRGRVRAVVPLVVVTAAGMGVLNASVLAWLGPILVAVLVARLAGRGFHAWRPVALDAGVFVVAAAALSFPALAAESKFISQTTLTLTTGSEFGNLLGPLRKAQAFGIWPAGDFRMVPVGHLSATYVLIGVEIAAIVLGVLWALRRGRGWPLVFTGVTLIGCAYVIAKSNAWGDAKALMIASPAVVAAAMLGPAALWSGERRVEALLLASTIAFGVLWSNALAYHDADLAPRDRLAELSRLGDRFAGQGPALYTEFEEFDKHFLHRFNPSGSNDAWQDEPRAALASGGGTRFGFSSDLDELVPGYVERFRTLVLRRSGSASRPPSNYRLVYAGRFYDVWQKRPGTVVSHVALGNPLQPGATPSCRAVRALASAGGARIAYVERPQLPVLMPTTAQRPRVWHIDSSDPTNVRPVGAGTLTGTVDVPQPGRYTVWVQGSFGRRFDLSVDGRPVGSVKNELSGRGESVSAGVVTLSPGRHTIRLVRPSGNLAPGDGGRNRLLGPIVLDPSTDTRTVRQVPASGWRQLCGKRLDWMESVR